MAVDRDVNAVKQKGVYWVWAQAVFGPGSPMPAKLHREYPGGLEEFFRGGRNLWRERRDLKDKERSALISTPLSMAVARLDYAASMGWRVVTPLDRDYPPLLRQIENPPAALYVQGRMPDASELCIALVGARKPLPTSSDAAMSLGYQLATGGARVVSGGAVGVDAAAINGALRTGGSRILSVLPVSLDSDYVRKNLGLREAILRNGGALATEYFSQLTPQFGAFQLRNRLITGICRGVVIIQAGAKSGSVMYASHALEQNRDVFVFPGPEGAEEFSGSSRLLREGAIPVTSGEDVLRNYGAESAVMEDGGPVKEMLLPRAEEVPEVPTAVLTDVGAGLRGGKKKVWDALGREAAGVAELSEKTGMAPGELFGALTELELEGLVRSLPGKRYVRQ